MPKIRRRSAIYAIYLGHSNQRKCRFKYKVFVNAAPVYTRLNPTTNAPMTTKIQLVGIVRQAPESSSLLLELAPAVTVTVARAGPKV